MARMMGLPMFWPSIGDIGGGHGHLLKAVLGQVTQAKGRLFDQPHLIDEEKELAFDRIALQAGDFFEGPLSAGKDSSKRRKANCQRDVTGRNKKWCRDRR